jgi:hypothetical protein
MSLDKETAEHVQRAGSGSSDHESGADLRYEKQLM